MRFAAVDAKAESLRLQYARNADGEVSPPTSYATPSSVIDASGSSARSIDSAPAVVVFTSQSMVPKPGAAAASVCRRGGKRREVNGGQASRPPA